MAAKPKTLDEVVRWWYANQRDRLKEANTLEDHESAAYHDGFVDALRVVAKAAEIDLG